jgi:hypothetical protein
MTELAFLIAVAGVSPLVILLVVRWTDAQAWQRRLVAYRLHPARGLTADQLSNWLSMLASTTRRWPVAVELVATSKQIAFYLVMHQPQERTIVGQLRAVLPGARLEEAPEHLSYCPNIRAGSELRLTSLQRPLAHDRAESAVTALLSGLHPLARGEVIRLQWILSGARALLPRQEDRGDIASAVRRKHQAPVFSAVGRIGISAPNLARAVNLLNRVTNALRVLDAPGVSVVRRMQPTSMVAARLNQRTLPLTVWPLRLNAKEAVGLLGIPLGALQIPGLGLGTSRQLPAPDGMGTKGLVLAESDFTGMQGRPLVLTTDDRLRHLHLLGPTGVGKSTLLANLALQDLVAGSGLLLVDPKSDLVEDVLKRLPASRLEDVLVLDPSATDLPIGFNVLQTGTGEHQRELVVDHVVHVFSQLWRSSWGPRTADCLRAALLTLTHARALDGSAFTLCETPELLLNPSFRRFVTAQPGIPEAVRSFWLAYEQMSDGERAQVIGPVMNKLRSLTSRTALRLILGQSQGLDLADIFRSQRIVLVPLSKGTIGAETAHLLGSLLMAGLWQAAQARSVVPADRRRPAWAYLDEFQDVLRLGSESELADMLAQARGLGLGLVLAHQYLDQLPHPVQAAVLGTTRSQVVFQCDDDDAKTLERRFAPALGAADLMGLETHQIAVRASVDGQTRPAATGKTLPLSEPLHDPRQLAHHSRQRFGVPRKEVEASLRSRLETGTSSAERIGRTRRGGAS